MVIAHYYPNGNLAWAKDFNSTPSTGAGIFSASDNSIVVTGKFSDNITFGKGEPAETVLKSNGREDMFIAKYSSDGLLIWARGVGGIFYDFGRSIATVSDKFVIVTGVFKDTVTFGKGEINETILKSASSDNFIAKYAL
jgi:hypothetical protein